jgi:hypothetical protein
VSVDGKLCLQSGLWSESGDEWTYAMSGCVLVQIGEPVLLLSPRIGRFAYHYEVMEGLFVWRW